MSGTSNEAKRLLEEDDFSLWIPGERRSGFCALSKAGAEPEIDSEKRLIHGFCTTEDEDRQQEIVVAKGLNFEPFIRHGWLNDNHSARTFDVLGWPVEVQLYDGKGWYLKGQLLKGKEAADKVWELAVSLFKSGSPRRLGFSIEGRATLRNSMNRIIKGDIRHVAITRDPVNPNCTFDAICKAFAPVEEIEQNYRMRKALSVGHARPASSGAAALLSQDLEGASSVIKRKKHLRKADVLARVRSAYPNLSPATYERATQWIMSQQG